MIRKKIVLKTVTKIFGLIMFNWLVLTFIIISLKLSIDYLYASDLNIMVKQLIILFFSVILIILWLFLWRYSIKVFKLRIVTKHGAEKFRTE